MDASEQLPTREEDMDGDVYMQAADIVQWHEHAEAARETQQGWLFGRRLFDHLRIMHIKCLSCIVREIQKISMEFIIICSISMGNNVCIDAKFMVSTWRGGCNV